MHFKKFLSIILLITFNVNATVLTWSYDAEIAYNSMYSGDYYSRSTFQTNSDGTTHIVHKENETVAFKYNDVNINLWSKFNVRKVIGITPSGKTINAMTIGVNSCQCVEAVMKLTGYSSSTTTWIEGDSITQNNLPDVGTVIATFTNGKYDYRHTAIVVGRDGNGKWLEVIDQNWHPLVDNNFASRYSGSNSNDDCTWNANVKPFYDQNKKGIMLHHKINFNGTGVNNLSNYSVVNIP